MFHNLCECTKGHFKLLLNMAKRLHFSNPSLTHLEPLLRETLARRLLGVFASNFGRFAAWHWAFPLRFMTAMLRCLSIATMCFMAAAFTSPKGGALRVLRTNSSCPTGFKVRTF